MQHPTSTLLRFTALAPLALMTALVAANTGCIINATDLGGFPEPDDCPALDEACPALACEFGNVVNDAGCEICECNEAPVCGAPTDNAPECEGAYFDERACQWVCPGFDGCRSDADCAEGEFCAFVGSAEAPDDGSSDDRAAPAPTGECLPLPTEGECTADSGCARGERCVFSRADNAGYCLVIEDPNTCVVDADCRADEVCTTSANGGRDDRADPPEGAPPREQGIGFCTPAPAQACTTDEECAAGWRCENANLGNGLIAPSQGTCVLDPGGACFDDGDCRRGQHCDYDGTTPNNALIALSGTCVDDTNEQGCQSDADCNGGRCEQTCQSDPNCPECDVCFFVGVCTEVFCFSDEECGDNQYCDLGFARMAPPADCDPASGVDCDPIPPPQGICRDIDIDDGCFSDDDCARDEFCDFSSRGEARRAPCQVNEETGTCDPIAPEQGVCSPRVISCTSDDQCNEGEYCDVGGADRPAPPCDLDDPNCAPIPPLEGVCTPIVDDGCQSDRDCAEGQVCEVFEGCACPAVCIDDGQGGCLPCECPPDTGFGICIDAPTEPTICVSDDDCDPDQVCVFTDGDEPTEPNDPTDPNGAQRPARTGECKSAPAPTNPCAAVLCAPESICVVDEAGEASCVLNDNGR